MGLAEVGVGPPSVPGRGALGGGPAGPALPYSRPVGITIPAIGVQAPVEAVGRAPNGAIDPPPLEQADIAGWYAQGPAPGEPGASVIVGHADDRSGPAVFYRLRAPPPRTPLAGTPPGPRGGGGAGGGPPPGPQTRPPPPPGRRAGGPRRAPP